MTMDPSPVLNAHAPPCGVVRARPHTGASIGVPWVLVLLHALALVVSSMAGMAMALFAW